MDRHRPARDTGGMKNEVVIQVGHLVNYGHPVEQDIRLTGARVVPFGAVNSATQAQLDGAIGPANAGASEELLSAKVLRGEYPTGYTPKRPGSTTMPRFEYLADKIPALAAYLAEVKTTTPE